MRGNLIRGFLFFWQGVHLVLSPGLKRFIIVPILVNLVLLIGIIAFVAYHFNSYFHSLLINYPHWVLILLGWLFWGIYVIASILLSTLVFTFLTNFIGAPFYGILAEKVENQVTGSIVGNPTPFLKMLIYTLMRECRKWLNFLPWILLCLLLFIIPFTWPIAPFAWWAILAWIMGIQFTDYAADNQQIPFKQMLLLVKQEPLTLLGFGGIVIFLMTIPGVNLFVPAAAVAGGTLLWLSLKKCGYP